MSKHKNIAGETGLYLEYLKQSGVNYILNQGQGEISIIPRNEQTVSKDHSDKNLSTSASSPSSLEHLNKEITGCNLCTLGKTRTNIVYGVGNPKAKLVFVGEAPGRDEDQQGIPFVGRAGKLLTKIIEAINLKREDVYICNIIKCRPPENRNPLPEEIEACEPFLLKQLESIKPKAICTLGKFATQALLKTETPISTLRGIFQDYHGIPLMPTYHPAYLMRNPKMKKAVWEDIKLIQKSLEKGSG